MIFRWKIISSKLQGFYTIPSIYINSRLKRTTRRELPYYPLPCVGRVKINATANFLEGSIVITKSAFDIVNISGSHKSKVFDGIGERRTTHRTCAGKI